MRTGGMSARTMGDEAGELPVTGGWRVVAALVVLGWTAILIVAWVVLALAAGGGA